VSVPPARIAEFTDAVRAELATTDPDVRVCDFGHWGDGGTHLNLVWAAGDDGDERAARLQVRVYRICVDDFGGSFSAEHGVGPHNQAAYREHVPEAVRRTARVLGEHFDPGARLGTVDLD
jgi:FAD/FMN-containing dehydrogenase